MIVEPNLCQTRSETTLLVFPRGGSILLNAGAVSDFEVNSLYVKSNYKVYIIKCAVVRTRFLNQYERMFSSASSSVLVGNGDIQSHWGWRDSDNTNAFI